MTTIFRLITEAFLQLVMSNFLKLSFKRIVALLADRDCLVKTNARQRGDLVNTIRHQKSRTYLDPCPSGGNIKRPEIPIREQVW